MKIHVNFRNDIKHRCIISSPGFTLVEIMIVISIIGVLASIAMPWYFTHIQTARNAACLANRHYIEMEEREWYLENNQVNLEIDHKWSCPEGGVYVWLISDPGDPEYPNIICSLHGEDETEPLTSLGSTSEEILGEMTVLIEDFYESNGRYPRSWGDYRFEDIGLDPDEWADAHDGIVYTPLGKRINISPDEGVTFFVTDTNGNERKLEASYNWNLVYSVEDGEWYYHRIEADNKIDISTLKIVED